MLIVAEMFLPGMVLGILGAIMLSASVVVGFSVYGATGGTVVLCVVMTGSIIAFFLWMNFFQRTAVGRNLTLGVSLGSGDDLPEVASLLGKDGRALTDLRPAGKIEIDGRRLDVVAESAYVESGSEVTVVQAGGSRVVVRKKS